MDEKSFQFGMRRMFVIMSLLAVLCASVAAIRSASPVWLFIPFIVAQAVHFNWLVTLPCRLASRGCVRGFMIGAAVSVLLFLIGGVPAVAGLLPFMTKGNALEPFIATPIGLVLTGAGFSLMCGVFSGSITLFVKGNHGTSALSLVMLVVWLFLVSLAVLARGPTLEGTRLASLSTRLAVATTSPRCRSCSIRNDDSPTRFRQAETRAPLDSRRLVASGNRPGRLNQAGRGAIIPPRSSNDCQPPETPATPMEPNDPIERIYARRAATFARRARELQRRSNRISYARLGVFLVALVCLVVAVFGSTWPEVFFGLSAGLAAGLVFLIVRHRAVLAAEERHRSLATINQHALARVRREWAALPAPAVTAEANDPPFARDLDLFGQSSLVQLLGGGGATALGRQTLRSWLLEPAAAEAIAARQQAVAELADQLNRRQRFVELGRRLGDDARPTERFLAWADDPPWLASRAWLRWTARLLPIALVASGVAEYVGLLPISLWMWILVFNVALSLFLARTIHGIFNQVSSRAGEIAHYASLFALAGSRAAESERLRQLEADMNQAGHGATARLDRLARLVSLADLRLSQMVHAIVQALTLWDFHVLDAIERWQARSKLQARLWFAALAEWDALATLAAVAHDNPDWAYAEISNPGNEAVVAARGLGHPLLAASQRVVNDVSLGPPGTFLLVTGSNMSGKSTLLRAIGTNAVLAQAGGAVAAESFRMPPVVLATSMRVEDSLADGTSLFMAELKRLKQIVDAACQQQAAGHERRLLFLLDEILHGTNSVERQVAVRRVMLHLLQQGAIGAISTHDLALANVAPLDAAGQAVHFQESFSDTPAGRRMVFDYQLRPGLATTTNALALLEMVGLVPPDPKKVSDTFL